MKYIYQPKGRAFEYAHLAVNIANGCVHGCQYCYAPGVLRKDRASFHESVTIRKDVLAIIEKDLAEMKTKGLTGPVMLCFTCDAYQNDEVAAVTRKVLILFRAYGVTFQVLTKGGMRAAKDFDLYSEGCHFATSLTCSNQPDSAELEPGAATPLNRVAAIRSAKEKGISTWVSFEPVLFEKQVYDLFSASCAWADLYKIGKVSGFKSDVKDWGKFARNMIQLCEWQGVEYYLKDDLKKHL